MSDAKDAFGFGKFVPGFDFLQNLAKGAPGMPQMPGVPPGLSNWVAPTISVEELDKRIEELKAVQFWLDQNSTALKATVQALEVQKMTLATLKGMNFSMEDMAEAFKVKPPADPFAAFQKPAEPVQPAAHTPTDFGSAFDSARDFGKSFGKTPARKKPARKTAAKAAPKAPSSKAAGATPAPGVVDPMQWWGALTDQFQQIAASAMKEVAQNAAASGATNNANAAGTKPSTSKPTGKTARKTASKTSRSRKAGA